MEMNRNQTNNFEADETREIDMKNGEAVDLTGWNDQDDALEDKDSKKKEDGEAEEEEASQLPKTLFQSYYNMNHALKMVIVKPYTDNVLENEVYRHWVKMARSYDIIKRKDGSSEAVFYYGTILKGDGAYLDFKTNIEDEEVKVFHPSAMPDLKVGKYWECLKKISTLAKPPVTPDVGDKIFSRQIVIEHVPESVTEDDLLERYPEVLNVICFPHVKGTKGLRLLEFESESSALKFLKEHKDDELGGVSVKMTKYARRANEWEDRRDRESYVTVTLDDEERLDKCKRQKELEGRRSELVNREDIFGEEKISEHLQLIEEIEQVSKTVKADTDRRILKKEAIPEPDEIKSAYTKYTDSKEWIHSSRARKAAQAYGVERERPSRKAKSPTPSPGTGNEADKCYNCGGKGHFARDCPSEREGVNCYNCGRSGHFARDCGKKPGTGAPGSGRRRSRSPLSAGPNSKRRARSRDRDERYGFSNRRDRKSPFREERDRRDRRFDRDDRVQGGRGDNSNNCYKCGRSGHFARECGMGNTKQGDTCYNCGGTGHYSRDCSSGDPKTRTRTDKCYVCGGEGHFARECPNNPKAGHRDQNHQMDDTSYRRDSMGDGGERSEWRSVGMEDRTTAMRDMDDTSSVNVAGLANLGEGGSDIVANMMRMAGAGNAPPAEVANILQNISQSLSSSVARLERVEMESRIGRRY